MSEVKQSEVKQSYWSKDAYFPASVRFLGRRVKGLVKEGSFLMAGLTLFMAGQLFISPDSSPMTFEQVLGQVESLAEVGDNNIPTMTVNDGDQESIFKRIGNDWSQLVVIGEQKSIEEIPSSQNSAIEKVYSEAQAGIIPAEGQFVKVSTYLPRFK